jgi:hypothetical protein
VCCTTVLQVKLGEQRQILQVRPAHPLFQLVTLSLTHVPSPRPPTPLSLRCTVVQVKLAEQTDIASEASSRAEQLEEDLAGLRAQVAQVRV